MTSSKILIGDVFSFPILKISLSGSEKKQREEYHAHLKKVLKIQIQAFTAKFNDAAKPRNCYVCLEEDANYISEAMPETVEGIVTYWQQLPLDLKQGQAVFTSGW